MLLLNVSKIYIFLNVINEGYYYYYEYPLATLLSLATL